MIQSRVLQSLVLPFAYLLDTQPDTVLDLLESTRVQDPATGAERPALEILLRAWCDNADGFQGYWSNKVR